MADAAVAAFRAAVGGGVVEEVERMLDEDPGLINHRDPVGQATPLIGAAGLGHLEVVLVLLRRGADINLGDGGGGGALMWAAFFGQSEVVGVLLENGADCSTRGLQGWTALMAASSRGHLPVAERLLQHDTDGAIVNVRSNAGSTAVWFASFGGHHQVVTTLLLVGRADPTIADNIGVTPRQIAEQEGHQSVLEVLDWYDGEVERAYFLARARDMVDDSDTISKAPEKAKASTADEAQHAREEAAPVHLKGRVEKGGELPVVEVAVMPRRSKRGMGCEAVSLMEEEEQRRAALEHTVKWMKRDLFEVLMQMMRYR